MRKAALSVATPCGFLFAFCFVPTFVCVCVWIFCSDFCCADFCCEDFMCADFLFGFSLCRFFVVRNLCVCVCVDLSAHSLEKCFWGKETAVRTTPPPHQNPAQDPLQISKNPGHLPVSPHLDSKTCWWHTWMPLHSPTPSVLLSLG